MKRSQIILLIMVVLTATVGCSYLQNDSLSTEEELTNDLNALTDELLSDNQAQIKNAIFEVVIPSKEYVWKNAWGYADPQGRIAATVDDQFYAASIGKMTLATLTLLFVEEDVIDLDDPISMYLPATIMTGLHVIDGIDYSEKVTVKHLLRHTSGLQDYFEDGDFNSNQIPDFQELMMAQPDTMWLPTESIDFVKENLTPVFPPGNGYHYSDTGYVLMGMILENVSEMDLAQAYRQYLWKPLNMSHTYFKFREESISPDADTNFAHTFSWDFNMTDTNMLSADWAGGGIITTTDDLYKFLAAWNNNQIFQYSQTIKLMTDYNPVSNYGLGHWRVKSNQFEGTLIGHEGSSQSFLWYVPEYDAYIIGTLNQTEEDDYVNMYVFVQETLKLLKKGLN